MTTDSNWSPPPAAPILCKGEIHLWRASLDREHAAIKAWAAELAEDERARAAGFVFRHDRVRYIAGRGILRAILGQYMRRPPADIEFAYEAYGKPKLRVRDEVSPIRFNVSHSHGLAVYAFSFDREIGVDIEAIRSEGPPGQEGEIAEQFFSSTELAEFRLLQPEQRIQGFFLCWTRKEAYLKALGAGLTAPLDGFSVSLTPGMPERLQSADSARWRLHSFEPEEAYAGAVAAEGGDCTLRFWNFQ